jgi:GntR family transcriptional regulator
MSTCPIPTRFPDYRTRLRSCSQRAGRTRRTAAAQGVPNPQQAARRNILSAQSARYPTARPRALVARLVRSRQSGRLGRRVCTVRTVSLEGDLRLEDLPDLGCTAGVPAYQVIEQWLGRLIFERNLLPGDKLPTESGLAAALGVSRMTLRQALASLEGRGVLERRRGRNGGTFIAAPKIDCDVTGLAGFTEQMRRANVRPGARLVSATTVGAPGSVAGALQVERGAEVHEVIRVRSANREPLALERSYFPARVFPDLLDQPLSGSLYALMQRKYRQEPHTSSESLEPVIASEDEAKLLRVEAGSPLMLIERTAYTVAGLPVECAFDLYRADRTRITVRTELPMQG